MLLFGQAPIDFMLEGELLNENGEREVVGLRRIDGYSGEVHRLKLPACMLWVGWTVLKSVCWYWYLKLVLANT